MPKTIIPPSAVDVEQALLGTLLLSPTLIHSLDIKPHHFYETNNKTIFTYIQSLVKQGKEVDLITLKNELEQDNKLEPIGGMTALVDLTESVPVNSNAKEYCSILIEKSQQRETLALSYNILDGISRGESSSNCINNIYKALSNIEEGISGTEKDIGDVLEDTLDLLDIIKSGKMLGTSFGSQFKWLDVLISGLQRGKILRIGGGSNVGKSWLLYNFLLATLPQDPNVTFFALENSDSFTMKNLLGLMKGENSLPEYIFKHKVNYEEQMSTMLEYGAFYIDSKHKSLDDIFRIALKNKSHYIFIDYIQIVDIGRGFNSDVAKFAEYSLRVQQFASKYNVGVIDLSQLSNDTQRGGLYGAGSSEFKGGGDLKASADIGIHIFEDVNRMEAKQAEVDGGDSSNYFKNYVKIKLTKNRLGGGVNTINDYTINFDKGGKYELY